MTISGLGKARFARGAGFAAAFSMLGLGALASCGGGALADGCTSACVRLDECNGTSSDCVDDCSDTADLAEAAGVDCVKDVQKVDDCVDAAADCAAASMCGAGLGFGCIDQYCAGHPNDPLCP